MLGGIFGGGGESEPRKSFGPSVDYREAWERFQNASEAEIPSDENELLEVLTAALSLAKEEWDGTIKLAIDRLEVSDDVPALDIRVSHKAGHMSETRLFLCNRPTQGGGLKRQLDKVLPMTAGKSCVMLRASDYPAQQEEPDRSGLPQVPRRRRPPVPGADPGVGAHDDGA